MAATYDQKVFCRQALIGGNYGLLNATTFIPNPDYYGALLWHRLMGSTVLAVTKESDPYKNDAQSRGLSKGCNGTTVRVG
ncbi:hypothetical protein GQ457_01G017380 [Hibiscus cannabinus]